MMPGELRLVPVRTRGTERPHSFTEDFAMTARIPLLLLLAIGFVGPAFGQEAQQASVYKLRNAAAADVVKALSADAAVKKLNPTIVAEPRTNSVFVAGDAASQKRIAELLTALDKPSPSVQSTMVVLDASSEFA